MQEHDRVVVPAETCAIRAAKGGVDWSAADGKCANGYSDPTATTSACIALHNITRLIETVMTTPVLVLRLFVMSGGL